MSNKHIPQIFQGSSTDLNFLQNESVDYIYIDPPYGAHINYLDLSTIWYSWLNLPKHKKNDLKLEVIEGGGFNNSKEYYIELLEKSFKELYRTLKNNKHLSIAFSHKELRYWYEIVNKCEKLGFQYVSTQYYSAFYKSYHKISNPLKTMSGQLIINFKKTKSTNKIIKKKSLSNIEKYILSKIKLIISKEDSSTEAIFNKLIPDLLERRILNEKNHNIDIIHLLEENYSFDKEILKWKKK